jgi:hypothetical protein
MSMNEMFSQLMDGSPVVPFGLYPYLVPDPFNRNTFHCFFYTIQQLMKQFNYPKLQFYYDSLCKLINYNNEESLNFHERFFEKFYLLKVEKGYSYKTDQFNFNSKEEKDYFTDYLDSHDELLRPKLEKKYELTVAYVQQIYKAQIEIKTTPVAMAATTPAAMAATTPAAMAAAEKIISDIKGNPSIRFDFDKEALKYANLKGMKLEDAYEELKRKTGYATSLKYKQTPNDLSVLGSKLELSKPNWGDQRLSSNQSRTIEEGLYGVRGGTRKNKTLKIRHRKP